MTLTVSGDFTDPLSWIASRRVDALLLAGCDVEWRAVRGRPSLTVTATPLGPDGEAQFTAATEWLQQEGLPGEPLLGSAPRIAPCSAPPVSAFAEGVAAGIPDHVRHRLFEHYWVEHQDIGNPDVLRRLLTVAFLHARSASDVVAEYGYAVAISGGPITTPAWLLVRDWQDDVARHPGTTLPLLTDGETTTNGYAALARLGELVTAAGADFSHEWSTPLPEMPIAARRLSIERPGRRPMWRDA